MLPLILFCQTAGAEVVVVSQTSNGEQLKKLLAEDNQTNFLPQH